MYSYKMGEWVCKSFDPRATFNLFCKKLRMQCAFVTGVHLMSLFVLEVHAIELQPFTCCQPSCPIKEMVLLS